ncbi:hypothetical protein HDC90_004671 [Pedobacter sp. AK013]|uniref:hypothetical protein n=1 Tax=Pedobacter sp. AK013 TaxID=2723071 RepID=UPI00162247FC|nr:hypothetical protein [Pedobacter sp. AK013]MBB6240009.1 hypothetical protein [Pedobacter sp. AK013]
MLKNPELALCSNRNVLPKRNERSGSPEDWFSNDLLLKKGLIGVNFDFFVDWSGNPNVLTPVIWIKQVLSDGKVYADFLANIKGNIINRFGEEFVRKLFQFSLNSALQLSFIILEDKQDWNNSESKVCLTSVLEDFNFNTELLTIGAFKSVIQTYSGGAVRIGNKGLIYGTTNLECALSKTDSAYPGDLDMLLLDENGIPVAIFEFKKHTLSADVSRQTLSNYYPNPDGRKYDRLAIFKEYILAKLGHDIPIILLFYPTNPLAEYGRAEVLTGSPGGLKAKAGGKFRLPQDNSENEYERIINLIPKFIKLYQEGAL